jgi:hypothetical protein
MFVIGREKTSECYEEHGVQGKSFFSTTYYE